MKLIFAPSTIYSIRGDISRMGAKRRHSETSATVAITKPGGLSYNYKNLRYIIHDFTVNLNNGFFQKGQLLYISMVVITVLLFIQPLKSQPTLLLQNKNLSLSWKQTDKGYQLTKVAAIKNGKLQTLEHPSGEFTFLYSEQTPDTASLINSLGKEVQAFPDSIYKYIVNTWRDNLRPVPMNTTGTAFHFFPQKAKKLNNNGVELSKSTDAATIHSTWQLDDKNPNDILVTITLTSLKQGYFSIATPTVATLQEPELKWGIIPGLFQGSSVVQNLVNSYAYGHGIPNKPVVVRERTASTLSPVLSNKNGLSLAVIPSPGTGRDPWEDSVNTHTVWKLGLSLMNRKAQLTPTAYHPVLGQKGSYLKQGEQITFSFRYTLQAADWYTVYKHAANDVYRFADFIALKQTRQSLTSRILSMQQYLHNDSTSMWRVEEFNDRKIGAQAYLGGVVGSDRDAMKNSDYGAMWMLANITGDSILLKQRLPYARNFKLEQQQSAPGFFQGSAVGQYYLSKSKKFTEEWGPYVEPMGLTYYTMLDIGNILLFDTADAELKTRLRLGAERLLQWQYPDGHWEVGYDRATEKTTFNDLKDYRPTFYGLLVAYRMLGDKKYLSAAVKGADWFIKEAANKGYFLGVCGDLRFAPDFATGQSAQAMLDLFDITGDKKYQQAAIDIARLYTTSIYTQPIPNHQVKTVNGRKREDWEISQAGLSFEHGGSIGSANSNGPILLASHAGLFVRMFALTGDSLFINMARAAAWGRDAFVDSATSVASYYWNSMNRGSGPYPHHAWWQVGWLTDYLLAEMEMRSKGAITFPQGFITPKVGPHKSYGFAAGKIFGTKANLLLNKEMVNIDDPHIDYFGAKALGKKEIYLMLLNDDDESRNITVRFNTVKLLPDGIGNIKNISVMNEKGVQHINTVDIKNLKVSIPAFGLRVVKIGYE